MARKVIVRRLTGASVFNALLAISFPHAVRRLFAMRTSLGPAVLSRNRRDAA